MVLKDVHDKLEEIDEKYRELYTEKGGKFELTGIQGVKTQADIDRLNAGLKKERDEHKATKALLSTWGDLKHDDVAEKLAKYPELEAAAKGKIDEVKLEEMATRRADGILKSKLAPVERQLQTLTREKETLTASVATLTQEKTQRKVHDDVRKHLISLKVLPEAHEDALMLADRVFEVSEDGRTVTRDNVGVTPGIGPEEWLKDLQAKKPHWWPANVGGGSKGSGNGGGIGGKNPWAPESWNMTEQAAFIRANGTEKAQQMAQRAGTTLGALPVIAKKT